jgi:hypothetical protein
MQTNMTPQFSLPPVRRFEDVAKKVDPQFEGLENKIKDITYIMIGNIQRKVDADLSIYEEISAYIAVYDRNDVKLKIIFKAIVDHLSKFGYDFKYINYDDVHGSFHFKLLPSSSKALYKDSFSYYSENKMGYSSEFKIRYYSRNLNFFYIGKTLAYYAAAAASFGYIAYGYIF